MEQAELVVWRMPSAIRWAHISSWFVPTLLASRRSRVTIKYANSEHVLWFPPEGSKISAFYCNRFSLCAVSKTALKTGWQHPVPFLSVRGARMFVAQVADTGALATLGQVGCGWRSPEFFWYQISPSGVTFGLLGLGNAYQNRQCKHIVPLWPREGHIYLKKKLLSIFSPIEAQLEGFPVKARAEPHFSGFHFFFSWE